MKTIYLFLFLSVQLYSQIDLNINSINFNDPPIMEVDFTAVGSNDQDLNLAIENIIILEANFAANIQELIKNGNSYTLRFIPTYTQTDISRFYQFSINIFQNDDFISEQIQYGTLNVPSILFTDVRTPSRYRRLVFEDRNNIRQINLFIQRGRVENNIEQDVFINSVDVTRNNFKWNWQGKIGPDDGEKPPLFTRVGDRYTVDFFIDSSNASAPFFDIFTVTYDDGAESYLPIYARPITLPKNINLDLLEPNGGEIFAPCEEIFVRWEGNSPGIPIQIFLNRNGIDSLVGTSTSNTFSFEAPKNVDSTYKVKITQEFRIEQTRKVDTPTNYEPILLDFSSDGNRLISSNEAGNIYLVNTETNQILSNVNIDIPSIYDIENINMYGDKILIHLKNYSNDIIRLFDPATSSIDYEVVLNNSYRKIILNEDSQEFVLIPDFGKKIEFYNAENGQLKRTVETELANSSFNINFEEDIIAYIDYYSQLKVIDLNTQTELNSIDLRGTPYVRNLEISPNGRVIGLATKHFDFDGSPTEILIYDRESNSIVTVLDASATDPVNISFSPSSNYFVIASPTNPKIVIYDLTEGTSVSWGDITGTLNAADFAENQSLLGIAASLAESDPLQYTSFSYPETDISDDFFSIVAPTAEINDITVNDEYIFNSSTYTFENVLCNTSDVVLKIEEISLDDGVHFAIDPEVPITLNPGECLDITLEVEPKDVGEISDALIVSTCAQDFEVNINGAGLPRTLAQNSNPIQLGEICVGDTLESTITLFTNSDPVPILINGIRFSEDYDLLISNIEYEENVVLQPGDSYDITIFTNPDEIGVRNFELIVEYFDQTEYFSTIDLSVTGIGTLFDLSHTALPFIKSEPTRRLIVRNPSTFPINLIDARVNFPDKFIINQDFPVIIAPGDSLIIEITWDLSDLENATLIFDADPCPIQRFIPLVEWEGNLVIFSTDVVADDPTAETSIPVFYSLSTNFPYNGDLDLTSDMLLNPRLFFPQEVISKYNTNIENLGIEDGLRRIRISSIGNYNNRDTLAWINGVAGLAETDFTEITFSNIEFPEEISIQSNNGSLTIDSLCGTRRLIHGGASLDIQSVYPNPADNKVTLMIDSDSSINVELELYTINGDFIKGKRSELFIGGNTIDISLEDLPRGSYYIFIKGESTNYTINISKN